MKPQVYRLPSGQGLMIPTKELAISQTDPTINFQGGIDTPVTELIVSEPRATRMLGAELFRPVSVPTVRFQWPKFGLERFQKKSAERSMRAEFQHSEMRADMEQDKLTRYGWAALLDRDELDNADVAQRLLGIPLNIRERHARLARDIVENSVEADRAAIALAAASYSSSPDLDTTLSSGSEWNHSTGGDSYASIRAQAKVLAGAHGLSVGDIEVFLTHDSEEAAYEDPTFREARANGGATSVASRDELARYWGVRGVIVADAYTINSSGTGIESLYGDVAILRVARSLSGYETDAGSLDSFVRFYWGAFGPDGKAMSPKVIEFPMTATAFPFEAWEQQRTVNTTAAAIIRNTHT